MDDENDMQWLPDQEARDAIADLVGVVDTMSRQLLALALEVAELRKELAAMKRRSALRAVG